MNWEQIRKGDEEAFQKLFYTHFEMMAQLAYRYVLDVQLAKDIAQEVFLKLWEKKGSIQIKTNIKNYLLKATRNTALNEIKKRKGPYVDISVLENQATTVSNPGKAMEVKEMEKLIFETIESLPPRCKTIFLLRKVDGLPLKEIAHQLEISPKTVENQMTKALKRIAESLNKYLIKWILFVLTICT